MSVLDDASLDDRARPILDAAPFPPPTDEALQAGLLLDDSPSPAMLEDFASWLDRIAELERAGLSRDEILRVTVRALSKTFMMRPPNAQIISHVLASPAGLDLARALSDELLTRDIASLEYGLYASAQRALVRLAASDALDERHIALIKWDESAKVLPMIAAALPAAKHESFLLALATRAGVSPAAMLAGFNATRAVIDTPALAAIRETLLAAARAALPAIEDETDRADEADRIEKLAAAHTGPPRTAVVRPSERAKKSLAYLQQGRAAQKREAGLGPLAEEAWASRSISVDAPELANMSAWLEAGSTRQKEIADAVAAAVGGDVDGFPDFAGNTIAVIMVGGLPYCVVPGGTVDMGFSPEEEAAVRAAAEVNAGCDNHYELYDSLLENPQALRPLTLVHVGPLLAQQEPRRPIPPAEVVALLATDSFRLPSEAEWEYLARGGVPRELTYFGPDVPDDKGWLPSVGSQGVKAANDFGMWGFGFEPEVCADVWHPTHEGAPLDGSPRRGVGPRVVRGGAAQLYPFQATGEWHLFLSAMRTNQKSWEFVQSMRMVIGLRIAKPS